VQIGTPPGTTVSLRDLATRLASVGRVQHNAFLLRLHVDEYVLTIFPDGRTIIGGTNDISVARSLHARYVGA
jgi:adenylyltransferase/sulfurtransferase